jgi:glycosyltransferase involved in cell wall biosynthesis
VADVAVIILTHNEERHLARAIGSVAPFAREIVVVDSFSSDATVAIARKSGAVVLQNRFINYAKQFQWALDNAPVSAAWLMRLDADEIVEPDLAREIEAKLPALADDTTGINLKRKHVFLGRWIRFGGRYPLLLLRIWRRGRGRIEDRWMDEHIIVSGGRIVTFDGAFVDHNLNDLSFFIQKHNAYATREAIDVLNQRLRFCAREREVTRSNSSLQTWTKRKIKEHVYNRMPFGLSAAAYFIYRYAFKLGFLDGAEGLCYHFLQGYWYRFLVGAKVLEFERAISGLDSAEAIRTELERLTGLTIS